MANLSLTPKWVFELTTDELLLVLKGLTGRLKPEEVAPAKVLAEEVTSQRLDQTRYQMDRLEENVFGSSKR